MPLNLASPGILVREVDLTVGRVDSTTNKIGAIVGPFERGPVELPTLVTSEKDLLDLFGKPYSTDKQYETWLCASSYLAYGGALQVIRADDSGFVNAAVGTTTKIKNKENYEQLGYDDSVISGTTVISKTPGSWANGLRVGIIDARADQILAGIVTTGFSVGLGVTQSVSGRAFAGLGTTTGLTGYLKGVVTAIGSSTVEVKVLSHVSSGNTETAYDYQPSGTWAFSTSSVTIGSTSVTPTSAIDWFEQQNLVTNTSVVGTSTTEVSIKWSSIVDRPSTTSYAEARGGRFDELHIVVIDGDGNITGNAGTILEKHVGLSKAKDAEFSAGSTSYWRKYLAENSSYIYGGSQPTGVVSTGFSSGTTLVTNGGWDQNADGRLFNTIGAFNSLLNGGRDYGNRTGIGSTGALTASLPSIVTSYTILENVEQYDVDFILMGSANLEKENCQALANKVINVAETRKDSMAFVSPYRKAFITDTSVGSVTVSDTETMTNNVVSFYSPVTSSSYGVFDSGYKYMYDRFANTFRYVPLNGDIAGICARNDINNFPWFSPAGTTRGTILNAVKLAYNPTRAQRDKLYSSRVNPVIFSPGAGISLFGDKTALAKASAFDRINVRRLFIYLEDAISAAAKDQLFEFNDEITRTNFVNIVEPFLRDVQAKRGIFDFIVVCDETNNTAAIIDNNEFVADIYIKPARSINYIGLTFVATRTGVAFEEVIGNV